METKTLKPQLYVSIPFDGKNYYKSELTAYLTVRNMGYWCYIPSRVKSYVDDSIANAQEKHYEAFKHWTLSRCQALMIYPDWRNDEKAVEDVKYALKTNMKIFDNKGNEIPLSEFDDLINPHEIVCTLEQTKTSDWRIIGYSLAGLMLYSLLQAVSHFIFK